MGANASSPHVSVPDGGPNHHRRRPTTDAKLLEDMPESCVALVLSHLEPAEVCRLARVNRAFRAASSADFIWDSKLPSNYGYVLENLLGVGLAGDLRKRDIFSMLCKPIAFDGGTKEVWIDKRNGGMCLAISAKAMRITGIDDRRYWIHIPTEESRFQTIAYLQQIWWLEVEGDLDFHFPAGTYSLFFRLQLGRPVIKSLLLGRPNRVCNAENVHGWDVKPIQFQLTLPREGHRVTSRCFLDNLGAWENYHVGDFVVEDPRALTKVKFSLTQIDCTHTKGGLCVDSVIIRPSSMGKEFRMTQSS